MSDFVQAVTTAVMTHEVFHTRTGQVVSFQNLASDPGNYRNGILIGTNWGVSGRSAPPDLATVDGMRNMSLSRAISEVYQPRYGAFAAIEDQRVLTKQVDLAINMEYGDHGPATRILQDALNSCGASLTVDGNFGPLTIASCNATDPDNLLAKICKSALAYYRVIEANNPSEKGFFNNWNKRAEWVPPMTT